MSNIRTRIEITMDDTGRVVVRVQGPYTKTSAFGLLEVAKDMVRDMIHAADRKDADGASGETVQ